MTESPQLIVLGSIAFDNIETPFGKQEGILGGSAVYAAYCASLFANVGIVGIVGDDFSKQDWKMLMKRGIDVSGIQVGGKTFRWHGLYEYDMGAAKTLCTELNCLEAFKPILPDSYKKAKFVFLANTHPHQQMEVINQLESPEIIAVDTMNLWIDHTKDDLMEVIKKSHILILNDGETRALFQTTNLIKAAKEALKLGPKYIIIKKGEHGALMFTNSRHFSAPGYPLEVLKDPTGCGDCFGGALMGYIAGTGSLTEEAVRKGIIYGSVCASFNAEDFGTNRIGGIRKKNIDQRYREFREMRQF